MYITDRYAYANRIRMLDPAYKVGLMLSLLICCLLLNHPAVSLLTLAWSVVLALGWARLPAWAFGRVLLAEALFLCLSVIAVALSIGTGAIAVTASWAVRLGPLWIGSSPAALVLAIGLVLRTLGCASTLNVVIMTTPLVDLIELLRRLHTPPLLIDLMTLIYSSIFVLLDSLQRIYTAQESRGGYRSARRAFASAALLGSRLFVDAYQRSQRMQQALDSRGYAGQLAVLPMTYQRDRRVWWLIVALPLSQLLLWSST